MFTILIHARKNKLSLKQQTWRGSFGEKYRHPRLLTSNTSVLRNLAIFNNLASSKLAYFSLMESYIRYSIVLWDSFSKSYLGQMFRAQKRAIRSITNLEFHKERITGLESWTVASIYIIEVVSFVKDINLSQVYQHTDLTKTRRINPSSQHCSKLFDSKPYFEGHSFLELPFDINESYQLT